MFITQKDSNDNKYKVLVDPTVGPYFTLDEALQKVDPFTTIYLAQGVYMCTTPLTKPGLVIQKKDIDSEVYIVANHGAVLSVQLGASDFVVFKDVTICHSGMSLPAKFKENAPNDPKYTMDGSAKAIREFEINEHSDCCVMVHSGGILLRNCTLTLKSH